MSWEAIMLSYWGDVIRIAIASVLGLILGAERAIREKEAGMRTHVILIVGATLITCVSNRYADSARITAQIISGVGFIGAGIIMFRGEALHGITTATGVWTTAGIGIAVGNDLFLLAVCATVLVILSQVLLHIVNIGIDNSYRYIRITFIYTPDTKNLLKKAFNIKSFTRLKLYKKDGNLHAESVLKTSIKCDVDTLTELLEANDNVLSLERLDINEY